MVATRIATRPTLLCFSHVRWDFVWQRPQQFLSRAARLYDVIFFEESTSGNVVEPSFTTRMPMPGVTVVHPLVPRSWPVDRVESRLAEHAAGLVKQGIHLVVWFYTPMALPLARDLVPDFAVFDCMDDLASFQGAPEQMREREEDLLRQVQLVITGGRSLFESRRQRHDNVHLVPSGVDTRHFSRARFPGPDPGDQVDIARPRVGYFGVIDERIDFGLIAALASQRPGWQFVFIGPMVKIDAASYPRAANLHWLGMKPYTQLPDYLRSWTAGFMPFAMTEATRHINPAKTPEFLAAGLPVVSTPIADLRTVYKGLVQFASDAPSFGRELERLISRPDRRTWLSAVDRRLARRSWDRTWAGIQSLLPTPLPRDGPGRPTVTNA